MHPFAYRRAASIAEALHAHAGAEEPAYLAGGQTLIPSLKLRLAQHDTVIDLRRIPGLDRIERTGDGLLIGALAPHQAVADSTAVADALPALAGSIGDQGSAAYRAHLIMVCARRAVAEARRAAPTA